MQTRGHEITRRPVTEKERRKKRKKKAGLRHSLPIFPNYDQSPVGRMGQEAVWERRRIFLESRIIIKIAFRPFAPPFCLLKFVFPKVQRSPVALILLHQQLPGTISVSSDSTDMRNKAILYFLLLKKPTEMSPLWCHNTHNTPKPDVALPSDTAIFFPLSKYLESPIKHQF